MNKEDNIERLIKKFEEMLKTKENYFFDIEDFLDIVDHYIILGEFNMAEKAINFGLDQYPQNVDLLLFKTELFSFNNQLDKAFDLLNELKKIEPQRVETLLLEAELYSRKKEYKKAIKSLQKASRFEEADKVEIYEMMLVQYMYLENYRLALEVSLKTLKLNPESSTALYNAITCFDVLNKTDMAIDFLKEHIEKQPFSEVAWSLLAKKYIDKAQYQQAINALEYAIAIDDKFLGAYYDKAFAYTQLKKYDKALECYFLTLKIADPIAFTYYHIAKNYQLLNDLEKAVHFYFKAVDEDPGYYKSWIKLILIKIEQNQLDDALSIALRALEVINNQELLQLLGKIYLLKNNPSKAINAYEMSMKMGNPDLSLILQLADLYKQQGDLDNFRTLLLKAKKIFPDSDEIKKRMLDK